MIVPLRVADFKENTLAKLQFIFPGLCSINAGYSLATRLMPFVLLACHRRTVDESSRNN